MSKVRERKTYLAWLNNAYGQELAMAKMFSMHAKDASAGMNDFPDLSKRLAAKADESREHAALMRQCLERHDVIPHPGKTLLGNAMGGILGFTGDVTIDKVIMNNLTDIGMAQFEVGAYATLIAAAERMKDSETAKICRLIFVQERAMVSWLEKTIPAVSQTFLARALEN